MQACRRGGLEVRCGRSNVKILRYGALELHFRRVDVEAFRYAALGPECRREWHPQPTPRCLALGTAGILIKQSSRPVDERVKEFIMQRYPVLNIIGGVRPVNSIRAFYL